MSINNECGYCVPKIEICNSFIKLAGSPEAPFPAPGSGKQFQIALNMCMVGVTCDKTLGKKISSPGYAGPSLRLPSFKGDSMTFTVRPPTNQDLAPPTIDHPVAHFNTTNPGTAIGHSPCGWTPKDRGKLSFDLIPRKENLLGPLTELVCCEKGRGGVTPPPSHNDPVQDPEKSDTCCEWFMDTWCSCLGDRGGPGHGPAVFPATTTDVTVGEPALEWFCCTLLWIPLDLPLNPGYGPARLTGDQIALYANAPVNRVAIAKAITDGIEDKVRDIFMRCGHMQVASGNYVFNGGDLGEHQRYAKGFDAKCTCIDPTPFDPRTGPECP